MAVTNYYTMDGRIRGEATDSVRTNYLPDALGSVTATTNEVGTVQSAYRYKPYGSLLQKSGAGENPKFLWNGQLGYRNSVSSIIYVRARTYDFSRASWVSVDPDWPSEDAYNYANQSPTTQTDPTGTIPTMGSNCDNCTASLSGWDQLVGDRLIKDFCDTVKDPGKEKCVKKCLKIIGGNLKCLQDWCDGSSIINCADASDPVCSEKTIINCPSICRPCMWLWDLEKIYGVCGYYQGGKITLCCNSYTGPGSGFWDCKCANIVPPESLCGFRNTLIHEIAHHCSTVRSNPGHQEDFRKYVRCIKDCMRKK